MWPVATIESKSSFLGTRSNYQTCFFISFSHLYKIAFNSTALFPSINHTQRIFPSLPFCSFHSLSLSPPFHSNRINHTNYKNSQMKNDWLPWMDSDPDLFPLQPFLNNFLQSFLQNSTTFYVPGTSAIEETFGRVSKFAGAVLFWVSGAGSSACGGSLRFGGGSGNVNMNMRVKPVIGNNVAGFGFPFGFKSKKKSSERVSLGKVSSFVVKLFWREAKRIQSYPVLSIAAALVPPIQNLSSNLLSGPLQDTDDVQTHGGMDQVPKDVERRGCPRLSISELNLANSTVEAKTGIEFPVVLDNLSTGEQNSRSDSEVLVGTGSRTMTIVKIKSLKIYAFGFYVHPNSLCEKLGPKYASISADELNDHSDFYQDLLREDISMTVRLVVNCKGMKINSVKKIRNINVKIEDVKSRPADRV
ncbi:fatty-acid-binding protein 2 isoform X2 [Vicia villosa]|uniref:fatty-acid-binding protein 2 isoform X2 n=1 Tax=Vicia villosa TaxID=3911 RepID=UPI00273A7C79|nr:fatty-acid-binding protein 2 isoform X2 [Vicia villosa]